MRGKSSPPCNCAGSKMALATSFTGKWCSVVHQSQAIRASSSATLTFGPCASATRHHLEKCSAQLPVNPIKVAVNEGSLPRSFGTNSCQLSATKGPSQVTWSIRSVSKCLPKCLIYKITRFSTRGIGLVHSMLK